MYLGVEGKVHSAQLLMNNKGERPWLCHSMMRSDYEARNNDAQFHLCDPQ